MKFSIVIPTYNNFAELEKCLAALAKQSVRAFEVFVCVDGSTDGTAERLAAMTFDFPLKVLAHADRQNHGRSAARNLALSHLSGVHTLFLDSDIELVGWALKEHLTVLEKGGKISLGAVSYRNFAENIWARYLSERGVGKFGHNEAMPANYFITQNAAVPTEYVMAVDGFDEKINRYGGEDMDFGWRVHKQFNPEFIRNKKALGRTVQDKTWEQAMKQLETYGATGLPYITRKEPELAHIYHVNRVFSGKIHHQLFEALQGKLFRWFPKLLLPLSPWPVKKLFLNYLVICAVHDGFRSARQ